MTMRPDPRTPLPDDVAADLLTTWGADRLWPRLNSWRGRVLTYEVTITRRNEDAGGYEVLGTEWVTVTRKEAGDTENTRSGDSS